MGALAKPVFMKVREEQELFITLRQRVMELVEAMEGRRRWMIKAKAILFPLLYVAAYATALLWGSNVAVFYTCYFLLGCFLLLNFLNLIHDAVHHTLFEQSWLNRLYVCFFDVMGANSYIWKIRHIRLHHNYPNVMGWDSDFEQSPVARVFPHGAYSLMHKYQYLYLPLLYPLYLFNWLLVRDFKDFFFKSKLVWKVNPRIPVMEYVKLFAFKALFVGYTLVLPRLMLHLSWAQVLTAFMIMMLTASITSLVVLLSPHATPESEFPLPDEKGMLPDSWFRHQLSTTNDVSSDNWFIRFFMGSFNYHIAHHLFPHINHVYYPEITTLIASFAKEHHLPYRTFSLSHSLLNHYRLLKTNATHENIFDDTM
jgi:linoleoyl-CoA desaturase